MVARKIALVDDDAPIVELVTDLLVDEGFDVVTSLDARSAFGMLQREQPDVILLDLMLQGRDYGNDLLRALKEDPTTSHAKVVIFSANVNSMRAKQEELEAMGCFLLEKPFDLDTLLSLVRAH